MNGILQSDWLMTSSYIGVQTGIWTRHHSNMVTDTLIEKRFTKYWFIQVFNNAVIIRDFGPYQKFLFRHLLECNNKASSGDGQEHCSVPNEGRN